MSVKEQKNLAFIDAQNLYMSTAKMEESPWQVDLKKFRIYLKDQYGVTTAYYFLGFMNEGYSKLYNRIQEAGFILQFREHNLSMASKKKGNVDSEIIFEVMKKMYERADFDQIILVAGDGDYKKLVDFLIKQKKFKKILFPNRKFASSLYKKLGGWYSDALDRQNVKKKIAK